MLNYVLIFYNLSKLLKQIIVYKGTANYNGLMDLFIL